jgi:hypothetical protein
MGKSVICGGLGIHPDKATARAFERAEKRSFRLIGIALFAVSSAHAMSPEGKPKCPPAPELDCTPQQDCALKVDTRECNKCFPSPTYCLVRGNDPACEAEKAAQNQSFAMQKTQCEAQKTRQQASCEEAKAALNAAAQRCTTDLNSRIGNCIHNIVPMSIYSPSSLPFAAGGETCVTNHVAESKICASTGHTLGEYKVGSLVQLNVLYGGHVSTTKTEDGCVNIRIEGYSADHRGNFPNYLCSPMQWSVNVYWDDCPLQP